MWGTTVSHYFHSTAQHSTAQHSIAQHSTTRKKGSDGSLHSGGSKFVCAGCVSRTRTVTAERWPAAFLAVLSTTKTNGSPFIFLSLLNWLFNDGVSIGTI
jgi:hypothetical protein